MSLFQEFNLDSKLIEALSEQEYKKPTPIQKKAIPIILEGRDLIGCAQTGTGKTAAFALPILNRYVNVAKDPNVFNRIKVLVLAPTRELAIQIGENFRTYGQFANIQTGVIFGGVTPKRHIKVLKKEPSILVATPGRLNDLLEDGVVDLSSLDVFVLDEADRMLELGMLQDVKDIIALLPKERQNLMFSATMPKEIASLVASILHNPVRIEVKQEKRYQPKIIQEVYFLEETHKGEKLIDILKDGDYESVLIFVRTKKKADKLAKFINVNNIRTKAFHGDINQTQRIKVLDMFKNKEIRVLVATDVAARGIDIDQLEVVINFNIPNVPETYIHRIGRTGRAGEKGLAISLCSKDEREFLDRIEKLQGVKVTNSSLTLGRN
jgi:ATP-dependent RNA helicase RhlE